jgi:hypothetical protein
VREIFVVPLAFEKLKRGPRMRKDIYQLWKSDGDLKGSADNCYLVTNGVKTLLSETENFNKIESEN